MKQPIEKPTRGGSYIRSKKDGSLKRAEPAASAVTAPAASSGGEGAAAKPADKPKQK